MLTVTLDVNPYETMFRASALRVSRVFPLGLVKNYTEKWVAMVSPLAFSINRKHNHRLAVCLYNVDGGPCLVDVESDVKPSKKIVKPTMGKLCKYSAIFISLHHLVCN